MCISLCLLYFKVLQKNNTCCGFVCQGHVVMGNNAVSPYQQVIEKTKSLSFRSQMLAINIEKKVAYSNRNEVRWAWKGLYRRVGREREDINIYFCHKTIELRDSTFFRDVSQKSSRLDFYFRCSFPVQYSQPEFLLEDLCMIHSAWNKTSLLWSTPWSDVSSSWNIESGLKHEVWINSWLSNITFKWQETFSHFSASVCICRVHLLRLRSKTWRKVTVTSLTCLTCRVRVSCCPLMAPRGVTTLSVSFSLSTTSGFLPSVCS